MRAAQRVASQNRAPSSQTHRLPPPANRGQPMLAAPTGQPASAGGQLRVAGRQLENGVAEDGDGDGTDHDRCRPPPRYSTSSSTA